MVLIMTVEFKVDCRGRKERRTRRSTAAGARGDCGAMAHYSDELAHDFLGLELRLEVVREEEERTPRLPRVLSMLREGREWVGGGGACHCGVRLVSSRLTTGL